MKAYYPGNSLIDVEAAQWLARLGNPDPSAHAHEHESELESWLRRSPEHVRAFLEASDAFYRLDSLTLQLGADVRRLLDSATNVTSLPPRKAASVEAQRSKWRVPIAASIVALAIAAGWAGWSEWHGGSYATTVGEQRTVKLDDGSFVRLNTQSRIAVQFSGEVRQVVLLDGEALFTVEHDARRPFIVRTGDTSVRAVGTAFNVYRRGDEVQVAVVEGRVQVSAKHEPATASTAPAEVNPPLLLGAGEEARIVKGSVSKIAAAAVTDAVAWQQRRLVFRDAPLSEVAAEFNRYNKTQVRIEGQALQAKPLTGIFSADHPQSLILYLSEFDTLQVRHDGDDWVIRAP